jgi:hypothetical protein
MDWIVLVRVSIWLTFFLLIAGEVVAFILIPRFIKLYLKEHKKLEAEVKAIKRTLKMPEE